MLKREIIIVIIFTLIDLKIYSQTQQERIFKIRINYQSSFSPISETYEIDCRNRVIMRILPFKFLNDSIEKIKVRKLSTNKWSNMRQLMDNTKFDSINSSKEQGIDGAWYHIDIIYVKRSNKHINLWSGYAPESLIKIHEFIRENLNKNGANN